MRRDSWIIEPSHLDALPVIADLDAIRQYNPQRFEMEQLTAVTYEDTNRHICVGYKDIDMNEFWVRGHIPHSPVMPPALICEAAAQLANYYAIKQKLFSAPGGFVGLKDVRCRGMVSPGQRLYVIVNLLKIRGALLTCKFQCAVGERLICHGILMGSVFPWLNK